MTISADCRCDDSDGEGDVRENEDEAGSADKAVDENAGRAAAAVAENEAGTGGLCGDDTAGTSDMSDVFPPFDDDEPVSVGDAACRATGEVAGATTALAVNCCEDVEPDGDGDRPGMLNEAERTW